jgi:MoaA/NifB/PqqE/SkfB family radical SAM enzyme
MYLRIDDITEIQIDHTSRCNLGCPQCARGKIPWNTVPSNKTIDLKLDDYKIMLEPFRENQLTLFHCGNFGDALASPTFDETYKYSLTRNPKKIIISTNGSLRSTSWWTDFAKSSDKLSVTFAIDGLEDTNSIYRIGSNWKHLMDNVEAFINAGGKARWDFIEFEHNYHQIEQAESLAKKMGFEKFNVKYTARFAVSDIKKEQTAKGHTIEDRKTNKNQKDMSAIKSQYGSFDDYVENTKIKCKYKIDQKIFIDMNMKLWPCCWFGAPLYFNPENVQAKSFSYLEKLYGVDFNNLRKNGWELLEHDFFKNYLQNSWDKSNSTHKRIYTCGRTCGEKFEFSSGYGKNSNIRELR